jgi:hypothetical protein
MSEFMPLVSIIIPCFNDAVYIEQSVQSALDQTYENKEIIVVDDGSNQKTKAVLKRLEPKIDLFITQENKGTSAARNTGIAAASGDFILVLDSDDYFDPEFCEKAIAVFQKDSNIKMVTCYARWFWNNKDFHIFKPRGGVLVNVLPNNFAMGSSMIKKIDWKNVGGYDEEMISGFEDWEFYIRLHKNGGNTHVIPEVLFHYRKKKKSRNTMANDSKYELQEYIFLKHADLYKENFELFTKKLLNKIKTEEREKIKNRNRIDFRLGSAILRPFRFIKSIFKININY